jgi:hypothetical protein
LCGAGKFFEVGALLFRDRNIKAKQNRGGRIDGHGSGNFFQWNPVKEHFHVFQGIDGHADLAHLAKR